MSLRRPIDFQGIIGLDYKIVKQLEQFLYEKENRLAVLILNAMEYSTAETNAPYLPSGSLLKLSEAIEGFSKKVSAISKESMKGKDRRDFGARIINQINASLWEYTEILEGCAIELYQQVGQVPIDRWHLSIFPVVESIKEILVKHIEDFKWALRRLEKPLDEFVQKMEQDSQRWFELFSKEKTGLDPKLHRNLQQTEKFLNIQDKLFHERYDEFVHLSSKVEENLDQMKNYPMLALMEVFDQNLYIDVFRLLRMLELNHSKKKLGPEINRALKNLSSVDSVIQVFQIYYRELRDAIFNSSLEWKSLNQEEPNFDESKHRLQEKVKDYQIELRQLIHTMSRYRLFMLKNDPNPYVRSRWGFTEWIVGPEPAKAKKILNMIYTAQELDSTYTQFSESLAKDPLVQEHEEYEAHQEIDKNLHEMGQPLISRSVMYNRAKSLLEQLKACDELGSPHMSTVFYVEDVLSKAMREDWKYHVLHEFPLFHQIYRLHLGLFEHFDDPTHAFRLDRFHLLFDQIVDWIEKDDVYAHVNEIQLDISDMKTYLQDFLASVQRAVKDKSHDPFLDETLHKFRQQLLEYRYLFGQFFQMMMSKSQDGIQLRNQFLFVNQYFESVELALNELRTSP